MMVPQEQTPRVTSGEPGITAERPAWFAAAACGRNGRIGDDPSVRVSIMFPSNHGKGRSELAAAYAMSVCASCPVLDDCSAYERALKPRLRGYGVWAGATVGLRQVERYGYTHGEARTYSKGCRCHECTGAHSEYTRNYVASRKA